MEPLPVSLVQPQVSIVIPTKNAGPEFGLLLAKLRAQKSPGPLEIIVADSGSTDGTPRVAKRFGCHLIQIKPADFDHGRTRNLAAKRAAGKFLLFMVQDALPTDDGWIARLLDALTRNGNGRLAAASCVELPRADSDLYYNFMSHTYYRSLECLDKDRILRHEGMSYVNLRKNSQLSNIACLIRKDIFAKYLFRKSYAEDLDLGKRLLLDGYPMALLSSVKVIHSHNRPPFYFLKRFFVDSLMMADIFPNFRYPAYDRPEAFFASACHLFRIVSAVAKTVRRVEDKIRPRQLHERILAMLHHEGLRAGQNRYNHGHHEEIFPTDAALTRFLRRLESKREDAAYTGDLVQSYRKSLIKLRDYLASICPWLDAFLLDQIATLLVKLCAEKVGQHMGYLCLTCRGRGISSSAVEKVKAVLMRGI